MTFQGLPSTVHKRIFSLLDVPSVCRLYIAFSEEPVATTIAEFLDTTKIRVSAEYVITGDTEKIDFDTLAKLPPCDIHVDTSPGLMQLTGWHLQRIPYKLLALSIDAYFKDGGQLQLTGIEPSELSLTRMRLDTESIPTTVAKLSLDHCTIKLVQSFEHLLSLTHFFGKTCNFNDSLKLPQLITNLEIHHEDDGSDLSDLFKFDALGLRNLRHVCHQNMANLPWSQLESVTHVTSIESDHLDEVKEIHFCLTEHSLKSITCPKLKCVRYSTDDIPSLVDVTERFTTSQLAQLVELEGNLTVCDLRLVPNIQKLHISFDGPITDTFKIPPDLMELGVYSTNAIESVPAQLKVFKCWGATDVNVQSANLRELAIERASHVDIKCPRLTTLKLEEIAEIGELFTPNLVRLSCRLCETDLPFETAFPRLAYLTVADLSQDLILERHLKSVELESFDVETLSLSADVVSLSNGHSESYAIAANVFRCNVGIEDVSEISCHELQYYTISKVPLMVDKLTIDWASLYDFDEDFPVPNVEVEPMDDLQLLELEQCDRLKSIHIKSANFSEYEGDIITIPSSVVHFRLGKVALGDSKFDVEDESHVIHFECCRSDEDDSLETFGFSEPPASCYMPPNNVSFQPDLHEDEDDDDDDDDSLYKRHRSS